MANIPLSVVILIRKEKSRISDCIKSVSGWADEVIVVDDESADRTKDVAKSLHFILKDICQVRGLT